MMKERKIGKLSLLSIRLNSLEIEFNDIIFFILQSVS